MVVLQRTYVCIYVLFRFYVKSSYSKVVVNGNSSVIARVAFKRSTFGETLDVASFFLYYIKNVL